MEITTTQDRATDRAQDITSKGQQFEPRARQVNIALNWHIYFIFPIPTEHGFPYMHEKKIETPCSTF